MEFKRKRVHGKTTEIHKRWVSNCGDYRVEWRNELPGGGSFYAMVRESRRGADFWNFAGRRAPYRTWKAAADACRKHQRAWKRFLNAAGRAGAGRADRLKAMIEKSVEGKAWRANKVLRYPPCWAEERLNDAARKLLPGLAC